MKLTDMLFNWWKKGSMSLKGDTFVYELITQTAYKRLAINSCVNIIANALVQSKFRTFEKGVEKIGRNHYLFNVQPNQNQNASEFIHELVSNLIYENECLVIMQNNQLYIADDFSLKKSAFKENIYTNIVVNEFELNKTFTESEVFYFKLNNEKITTVIDSLYADYGKLLATSINHYKSSNALRLILNLKSTFSQKEQEAYEDLFNEQFDAFFNAEGGAAVLPLQDGLDLKEISSSVKGVVSRDIRAIVEDIFDFVSMAFHVPKGLLKGDVVDVDKQTDNLMIFGVNPIANLINDEVNRKFYTQDEFLERTYLKVDTSLIKYVDPVSLANALDKFLSSGTHSVNENRLMIGKEPIDSDWANEHFVTKNYQEVQEYLKGGGEK